MTQCTAHTDYDQAGLSGGKSAIRPSTSLWTLSPSKGNSQFAIIIIATFMAMTCTASAMEVSQSGTKLVVMGDNFRYVWDTRRGGELASVEQRALPGGWWLRGNPAQANGSWQRVNSTFAWKSLDTIPALSFSPNRGAYFSGQGVVAYANADRSSTLKIIRQSKDELVFETQSNPKILENQRLPIPWKVKQEVTVLDSGMVITRIGIEMPENEVYELDWASMSVNLDDMLYKEPNPKWAATFNFGWAFPGEGRITYGNEVLLQGLRHLPLDIDIKAENAKLTNKPLLYGCANYDLTHLKDSAVNAFAECCLEEALSLVNTREDFGSHFMIRPQSGMSPVLPAAGSMRDRPSFGFSWNLFDGKTRGLNERLTYRNTLVFAVGERKRSNLPSAGADNRNNLLGARIYYARDKAVTADEVKAMAAEGCDTLILGPWHRADSAAAAGAIAAAHDAQMRVGLVVDTKDLRQLLSDTTWAKSLMKDRDGLLVLSADFLSNSIPQEEFDIPAADGQPPRKVSFKQDGDNRVNAASFAICMRALRQIVGPRGFLIGQVSPGGSNLLSLAEFDLQACENAPFQFSGSDDDRMIGRNKGSAGFAPIMDTMTQEAVSAAAIFGDTPIMLYPAKDTRHRQWWQIANALPKGGFVMESDLLAAERRFTTSSPQVHGTLFDGGDGKAVLLLASQKAESAKVKLTLTDAKVKAVDAAAGNIQDVSLTDGSFDAGAMEPGQVKVFQVEYAPPKAAPATAASAPAGKEAGK